MPNCVRPAASPSFCRVRVRHGWSKGGGYSDPTIRLSAATSIRLVMFGVAPLYEWPLYDCPLYGRHG